MPDVGDRVVALQTESDGEWYVLDTVADTSGPTVGWDLTSRVNDITAYNSAVTGVISYSDTNTPTIRLNRTRGLLGAATVIEDDDELGRLDFVGAQTAGATPTMVTGARISAVAGQDWDAASIPSDAGTRFEFETTRDDLGTTLYPVLSLNRDGAGSSVFWNFNASTFLRLNRDNGTPGAITAILSGDTIGSLAWYGATDTDPFHRYGSASIRVIATEPWIYSISAGSKMQFQTSANTDVSSLRTGLELNWTNGNTITSSPWWIDNLGSALYHGAAQRQWSRSWSGPAETTVATNGVTTLGSLSVVCDPGTFAQSDVGKYVMVSKTGVHIHTGVGYPFWSGYVTLVSGDGSEAFLDQPSSFTETGCSVHIADPATTGTVGNFVANMDYTTSGSGPFGVRQQSSFGYWGNFGPRGVLNVEGTVVLHGTAPQPIPFQNSLIVKNAPTENATFAIGSIGINHAGQLVADDGTITMGSAFLYGFVDNWTASTMNGGTIDGLTHETAYRSFVTVNGVSDGVSLTTRVGYWASGMGGFGGEVQHEYGMLICRFYRHNPDYTYYADITPSTTSVGIATNESITFLPQGSWLVSNQETFDTWTYDPFPDGFINVVGDYTLNYTGGLSLGAFISFGGTWTLADNGNTSEMHAGFVYEPTWTNDGVLTGTDVLGVVHAFADRATYQVQTVNAIDDGNVSFVSQPFYQAISATYGVVQHVGFRSDLTIGSGTVMSNRYGFYVAESSTTGSLSNQTGLYIEALISGITSNHGIVNFADLQQHGDATFYGTVTGISGIITLDGTYNELSGFGVVAFDMDSTTAAFGASLRLNRQRSSAYPNSADTLGTVFFSGGPHATVISGAAIIAIADGVNWASSGNHFPASLHFYTRADGDSTMTERMTINTNGTIIMRDPIYGNTVNPGFGLAVKTGIATEQAASGLLFYGTQWNSEATIDLRRINGTYATPTYSPVLTGERIGGMHIGAAVDTTSTLSDVAQFFAVATESYSSTAQGCQWVFYVNPSTAGVGASTSKSVAFIIDQDGSCLFGFGSYVGGVTAYTAFISRLGAISGTSLTSPTCATTTGSGFALTQNDGGSGVVWSVFHDGRMTAVTYTTNGITGATTQTRHAGGTTSGAPVSGTFTTGDYIIAADGHVYICTSGGSPGSWADAGTAGGILAATFTAKGDLLVGSGSGTYDNLPVGTDNYGLIADSTVTTFGQKWAPVVVADGSSTAATGSVNLVRTSAAATIALQRAQPTAQAVGDTLGRLDFYGQYDTTAGHLALAATVLAFADETFSDASPKGRLAFQTGDGTTLPITRLAIDSAGTLHVTPTIVSGLVNPANFAIKSDGSIYGGTLTYTSNQPTVAASTYSITALGETSFAGTAMTKTADFNLMQIANTTAITITTNAAIDAIGVYVAPVFSYSIAPGGSNNPWRGFKDDSTHQNTAGSTAVLTGIYASFDATPTLQTIDAHASTLTTYQGVRILPALNGFASGVLTVSNLYSFNAAGITVPTNSIVSSMIGVRVAGPIATGTITTRKGIQILDGSGAGTFTTNVALEIDAQAAATTNVGIRNASTLVATPTVKTITAITDSISPVATVIELNNTSGSSKTLNNPVIADGQDGQIIVIFNSSAQDVVLTDGRNVQLAAATRTITTNDSIMLMYSATIGDWIEIGFTIA